MKKFFVILGLAFVCITAFAHSVEWYVDGSLYQTTTCDAGDSITPPTAPEKYGYHFVEWSEYTQLEYIESTGTQYIDTGIKITSTYQRVVSKFSADGVSNDLRCFGSQDDAGNCTIVPWPATAQSYPWGYLAVGTSWYTPNGQNNPVSTSVNTTYEIDITANNGALTGTYCGQTISTTYEGRLDNNLNITLFGNNRSNGVQKSPNTKVKIYYYKLYTAQNTLVRNFIPAKRNSDNVVGMYDTVSQTFFTNAGTGEFIAGPEVGDL